MNAIGPHLKVQFTRSIMFLPSPFTLMDILHFFIIFRSFSLQLGAREHSGRRPERHDHRGDVGASPRGLRHNHRLVHRHLPEAAGPRPEQAGVQDRRRPGRGTKHSRAFYLFPLTVNIKTQLVRIQSSMQCHHLSVKLPFGSGIRGRWIDLTWWIDTDDQS